jgi:hypothetical protein
MYRASNRAAGRGQRLAVLTLGFGMLFAAASASAAPAVLYTDLASAPVGAFVTVFGKRLSGAAVVGADVISQSDTTIVLDWDGTATTVAGVPLQVTTRAGRVREATTSTLTSVCNSVAAGDVIYLRGGTYSARCGSTGWGSEQFNLGAQFSGVAFIGYPGETVTVRNMRTEDESGRANDVTIANMAMSGEWCVHGASFWESDESGSRNVRVVNVDCRGTYGSANTMTGLISSIGGDGWKVLGSRFSNNAPAPINNNHAIYVNVGADDIELAWNRFSNMRMGHVIQVYTDGPNRVYANIDIHDNEFIAASPNDIRGISNGNCTADSTFRIWNNVLINTGQDFSSIFVSCGRADVFHNTVSAGSGPTLLMQWGSPVVTARNNVFLGGGISRLTGTLTQGNNVTTGVVDNTGRLTVPVMAPSAGISTDHDAQGRGATVTVGAFESAAVPRPMSPTALLVQ